MMNTRSKTLNETTSLSSSTVMRLGSTSGNVMRQNVCHTPAPSTWEASYTSVGRVCRAANTSSTQNGVHCQASTMITEIIAAGLEPRNRNGSDPGANDCPMLLSSPPVGASMSFQMTPAITGGVISGSRSSTRMTRPPLTAASSDRATTSPATSAIRAEGMAKSSDLPRDGRVTPSPSSAAKLSNPTHSVNGRPSDDSEKEAAMM